MRTLVLLRGLPGCGKSSLIKKLGLEDYTISADTLRLLYSAPTYTINGDSQINQRVNPLIWTELFKILEARMINGDFTIVDATHATRDSINKYKNLAVKYRYKTFVVDMSDVDIDTCKKRNKERDSLRIVPESVIDKMNNLFKEGIPSWVNVISAEEFKDLKNGPVAFKTIDLSKYNKVHHIGDIHGCFDVLTEYLSEGIKEDEAYIFCGDYLDRGPQNVETLKFMMSIADKPNVFLLEGNHEMHLYNWASDLPTSGKVFNSITSHELDDANISKKEVRKFIRKLLQCAYYTYDDKTIVVSHGGISVKPSVFLSTSQLIKGVGMYSDSTAVDNAFCRKYSDENCYSVHGHRNVNGDDIEVNDNAFNLEGGVEFGGHLGTVTISHTEISTEKIKNPNYIIHECEEIGNVPLDNIEKAVKIFRVSSLIKEKPAANAHISSFNFSRTAFENGNWNNFTTKARGLFINTETNEIVARGYEKFFKVNEQAETSLESLKEKLQFPLHVYEKENGFLGILGYDEESDELIIASKSTMDGEHVSYFKQILSETLSRAHLSFSDIKEYLKENNCSMVFEVIDPVNNPHIIEYKENKIVLLDVIKRELDFSVIPFEELCEVADKFGFEHKKLAVTINSWEEFMDFHNTVTSKDYKREDGPIEGFVISDNSGFMVKEKTWFYDFWKWMRSVSERIISTRTCKMEKFKDDADAYEFVKWMIKHSDDFNSDTPIIQIRNEYNNR